MVILIFVIFLCHIHKYLSVLRKGLIDAWNVNWHSQVATSGVGAFTTLLFPQVSSVPYQSSSDRRIQVVLNRLRMGHAGVAQYLYRFNMADTPLCSLCQLPDTIEHCFFILYQVYGGENEIILWVTHSWCVASFIGRFVG